jgi:hypothetical protein
VPAERAVSVSGRLILIAGVGSILGPLLGSSVMSAFGIDGLFDYMTGVAALFALFALSRAASVRAPFYKRRRPFLLVPAIFAHEFAHTPGKAGPAPTASSDNHLGMAADLVGGRPQQAAGKSFSRGFVRDCVRLQG